MVDANLPRAGGAERPLTQVAVGVLFRADGRFLLTTRPPGKAYAGHWEFPGGKIETGETLAQALTRELQEELGLRVDHGRYLFSAPNRYDYGGVTYRTLDAYFEFELASAPSVTLNEEAQDLLWLPAREVTPAMLAFDSLRAALPRLQALENVT
jgi:mutator protein MutT